MVERRVRTEARTRHCAASAHFRHRGDTCTFIAPAAVASGGGFQVGRLFAVANTDAAQGAEVEGDVTGVFVMPKSTAAGIILGVLSIVFAFAMIWYIWWLAAFSFAAIAVVAIGHTFNYNRDFYIPADEVVRTEGQRTALLAERV